MTGFIPVFIPGKFRKIRSLVAFNREALLAAHQTAATFELAYQARLAVDRIRFAIGQTEQFATNQPILQEVRMQLLDALDRLDAAERHFQQDFRSERFPSTVNGAGKSAAMGLKKRGNPDPSGLRGEE